MKKVIIVALIVTQGLLSSFAIDNSKVILPVAMSSCSYDNQNTCYDDSVDNSANILKNFGRNKKVILPQNIQVIDGVKKNVLTQSMFEESVNDKDYQNNITFIINYVFDLNGKTITLPQNCVLKFGKSGKFCNGTIIGNYNTYIGDGFGGNLIYKDFVKYRRGIINVDDLANCNTTKDIDSYGNYNFAEIINYNIHECVKDYGFAIVVFNGEKTYGFKSPIFLLDDVTIEGNGCHIIFPSNRSAVYSMDGVQAFLTNRKHTSIDGSTNNYTTDVLGENNISIKNIVFSNVNEMRNFGYNVNCERGLIALYGAENVQIDGVVAEDINTAHCVVWCVNMKNLEVKNCSFSQYRGFNGNGVGGIWSTKANYMHNISIHHNKFAFYGDESINIEMSTCVNNNSINISNNQISGSLLTVIHNIDTLNPINSLEYSNNTLEDVTGVVSSDFQGNPRPLLISGDIDRIDYHDNKVSSDSDVSLLRFYRPCHIKRINIIGNEVFGNVDIIIDNDAYIISCKIKNNRNLIYKFQPNVYALKDAMVVSNAFIVRDDISFWVGEGESCLTVKKNDFKSNDGVIKCCKFGGSRGNFLIDGNTFKKVIIEDNDGIVNNITIRNNVFE